MKRTLPALLVLLLLCAGPFYLLGTEQGARRILSFAESRVGIETDEIGGSLWGGLQIGRLRWQQHGTAVLLQKLRMEPRWSWRCALRSTVCLDVLRADTVAVTLPSTKNPGEDFELPPRVDLPLGLEVETLAVDALRVEQGDGSWALTKLSAELRAVESAVRIRGLALEYDESVLTGNLRVSLRGKWPVRMEMAVTLAASLVPEDQPRQWLLAANGPLRDVQLEISAPELPSLKADAQLRLSDDFRRVMATVNLRGIDALPAVAALAPWVQLEGPLALTLDATADDASLGISGAVAGYAASPLALSAELQITPQSLQLVSGRLVDSAGRERLSISGDLGSPQTLAPRVGLVISDLSLPREAEVPLTIVSARASAQLSTQGENMRWALGDLYASARYEETAVVLSGYLRSAQDHALFPFGELSGEVAGFPVTYTRDVSDPVARLRLPGGLETDSVTLSALEARIDPADSSRAYLDIEGDLSTELALSFERTDSGATLVLAPFEARAFDQRVVSKDPVQGRWLQEQAALQLEPFCWQLRQMSLCSNGARLGESGTVDVQFSGEERFDGRVGDNPYSVFASGDGQLSAAWEAGQFTRGDLSMVLPVLGVDPYLAEGTNAPTRFEDVAVSATATPSEQTFTLQAGSAELGTLNADLRRDGDTLSGQVRLADLSVPAFDDVLPEMQLRDGVLSGTLYVAGTLDTPELSGSLQLSNAVAMLPGQDVGIEAANLYVGGRLDEYEVRGDALLGGGPIQIEGNCCVDGALELSLNGTRNDLRLPMGLDATISPSLAARIDSESAQVDGTVEVHRGLLLHSGPTGDGIAVSDDFVRVDAQLEPPRRLAVGADIRAIIEPGFTLRSQQLEATLGGDLRILADEGSPVQLFGELQVLGGVMRAYGQGLRLDRGSVGFVGDPQNPDLNLSAIRDIRTERLTVGVRVSGTLEAPQLTLFSNPPRTDRETLSYLLRGRGPDAGAGADGTAMAMSLGASAINQSGLLERLNSVPGLSDISLGAEGSDDETAATISAYVGNRLYLSYGMGIYEPVNVLTARLYLRSRLWLEVVSRLESSFDLYYRFDRQ